MSRAPEAFIHIGPVKTGTTYIQKSIFKNAALLDRFGISYPHFMMQAEHSRFANSQFLWDSSLVAAMKEAVRGKAFLVSEEAIFFQPWLLRNPVFDNLKSKVILYVRRPAELIASWAAECAQPYNAVLKSLPDIDGLVQIDKGIELLARHYEEGIQRFIAYAAGARAELDLVIRPFTSMQMQGGDLLADFLTCLGIDAAAFLSDPDYVEVGLTNEGATRKFCDVSYLTWLALGCPRHVEDFHVSMVESVANQCKSGDPRRVIETISDETIERITARFRFFEQFLSETFLEGRSIFTDRYPSIFGKPRPPYIPVEENEIVKILQVQGALAVETGSTHIRRT